MLRVLESDTGAYSSEELALEVLGVVATPPLNDSLLWSRTHGEEARKAHHICYPEVPRIQPGLVVNAQSPWLACTIDDLTWTPEGPGLALYKAPYSKSLPLNPLPAHELQLCYAAAVCAWSRPQVDYVVWTPTASSVKRYTPESHLVTRSQLTLQQLWSTYLEPRLDQFYATVLQPLLIQRTLEPARIYNCLTSEYVAVSRPDVSLVDLARAFA
jgi:hypothetical protein